MGRGLPITDEDVAVDTIVAVGPGGHFLDQEHTLTNMRTIWRESVMDRRHLGRVGEGRAARRRRGAAAEHVRASSSPSTSPSRCPRTSRAELDRIVAAYERQALDAGR